MITKESPRVVHVTGELAPWAKVGGLADVCSALPRAQAAAGLRPVLFLPYYGRLLRSGLEATPVEGAQQVPLPLGGRFLSFNLFESQHEGVPLYLVQCAPLFERGDEIYTLHDDEGVRWVFFCRAVLESLQRLGFAPEILHAHDWTAALAPLLLRTLYAWDQLFARTRTVLTIHNLGYQGTFGSELLGRADLQPVADVLDATTLGSAPVNFLAAGLRSADRLTTVSPTYAEEIQRPEYGHGLDPILRERREALRGILNGIDDEVWGAEVDRLVPVRFSASSVWRKRRARAALLESVGLDEAPGTPVFGLVSRLAVQKGIDLLRESLPAFLRRHPARLVVLGSGEEVYESFFTGLNEAFPEQVVFRRGYDDPLAHRIEAGADFFLMPSIYEPCGLNQMYSQRYGTLPVVRRTGGLADTVVDLDEDPENGTGIVFDVADAAALGAALERAIRIHDDEPRREAAVRRAMGRSFGWSAREREYAALYAELLLETAASPS